MKTARTKIAAVIVTFHPQLEDLNSLIGRLSSQVDEIYLIDNSPEKLDESVSCRCQYYLHDASNPGIAAAQNSGLIHAINRGVTHTVLLDQDSEPASDMVRSLLQALHANQASLTDQAQKVAAVGPMYIDENSGEHSSFLKLGILRNTLSEYDCQDTQEVFDTDFLISSGCLIPTDVLVDVGLMDESLFIDYVDTDWGIRAKHKGYRMLGVSGELMKHKLGEDSKRLWFGRWRQVATHKSFRYYYIFRNALILYSRPESSLKWRLFHIKRLLMLFVFISWSKHARENIRFAITGIRDALQGKSGPMPL